MLNKFEFYKNKIFQNDILTELKSITYLSHLPLDCRYNEIVQEIRKQNWRKECYSEINMLLAEVERIGELFDSAKLTEQEKWKLYSDVHKLQRLIWVQLTPGLFSPVPILNWAELINGR